MPSNPSLPGRSTLAALLIVTACGEGPDDTAHEAFASTTDAVEAFAPPTATEQSFLALLNSERNGNGLAPLIPYWDLVDDAREHSLDMISAGNIYHNPDLANVTAPGWSKLGENVGVGPTTSSLHAAFMASPGHAANVLGDYRYVGIGAQTSGAIWVTFVFMQHPDQTLGSATGCPRSSTTKVTGPRLRSAPSSTRGSPRAATRRPAIGFARRTSSTAPRWPCSSPAPSG